MAIAISVSARSGDSTAGPAAIYISIQSEGTGSMEPLFDACAAAPSAADVTGAASATVLGDAAGLFACLEKVMHFKQYLL